MQPTPQILAAICVMIVAGCATNRIEPPERMWRVRPTYDQIKLLEHGVMEGHQPWRRSPTLVAMAALIEVRKDQPDMHALMREEDINDEDNWDVEVLAGKAVAKYECDGSTTLVEMENTKEGTGIWFADYVKAKVKVEEKKP